MPTKCTLIAGTLAAAFAVFLPVAARAAIIIDNFTTVSSTVNANAGGGFTEFVPGTGILISRTITGTVALPLTSASAAVGVNPGFAEASFNGNYSVPNLANLFTLTDSITSINATGSGLNALSFLAASSLGTSVTITASSTSTFRFTDPSSVLGINHVIPFTSFSNPAVFSNLTSLQFSATFPNAALSGPSIALTPPTLTSTVPEPLSLGFYAAVGTQLMSRRRSV